MRSRRRILIVSVALLSLAAIMVGRLALGTSRTARLPTTPGLGIWLEPDQFAAYELGAAAIIDRALPGGLFVVAVEAEHRPIQVQLHFTGPRESLVSPEVPSVILAVYQTESSTIEEAMAFYSGVAADMFSTVRPSDQDRALLQQAYSVQADAIHFVSPSLRWWDDPLRR